MLHHNHFHSVEVLNVVGRVHSFHEHKVCGWILKSRGPNLQHESASVWIYFRMQKFYNKSSQLRVHFPCVVSEASSFFASVKSHPLGGIPSESWSRFLVCLSFPLLASSKLADCCVFGAPSPLHHPPLFKTVIQVAFGRRSGDQRSSAPLNQSRSVGKLHRQDFSHP